MRLYWYYLEHITTLYKKNSFKVRTEVFFFFFNFIKKTKKQNILQVCEKWWLTLISILKKISESSESPPPPLSPVGQSETEFLCEDVRCEIIIMTDRHQYRHPELVVKVIDCIRKAVKNHEGEFSASHQCSTSASYCHSGSNLQLSHPAENTLASISSERSKQISPHIPAGHTSDIKVPLSPRSTSVT